ncbi:MAG: superoxide dismutase family protein [Burkholderiales bacterium]|nr:superoxide dismutase family protein [Burkholderiales bacterium]
MKHIAFAALCLTLVSGCASFGEADDAAATAKLEPLAGSKVSGTVTFTRVGSDIVRVSGEVRGHTPGPKGFHIHEKGDCSDPKGMSAGGHFNPGGHKHGGPYEPERHAGDLGNINFDKQGVAAFNFVVGGISVSSGKKDGIIGRSVIVHAAADDLETDPTGNSGGRVACGIIK